MKLVYQIAAGIILAFVLIMAFLTNPLIALVAAGVIALCGIPILLICEGVRRHLRNVAAQQNATAPVYFRPDVTDGWGEMTQGKPVNQSALTLSPEEQMAADLLLDPSSTTAFRERPKE